MPNPMQDMATSIQLSANAIAEAMSSFKHSSSSDAKREALASAMVHMQSLTRKWNEFMVSHGRRVLWNPPP